ncbi:uncharacterized protein BYT42DRAFT_315149 [Radiomyces spectabilis]|uniref:uncharacterized protein n=1 Tax=Radiomyces spectabilis TaxID=64574 RepID=UPI00222101B0|nr:uncharacterized protein BYT42DRAFT_315149 [Radiomyces spectabilis]KAI8379145.1 hypothetical protein BYT42DRAFT_315149 [Radiomyces spectabilis]
MTQFKLPCGSVTEESLPSLNQVLQRQSQPPVCLYNYYIVLRDRLQLELLLDFWLDVQQADILYRRYLKYASRASKNPASTHETNSLTSLPSPSIHSKSMSAQLQSESALLTHMLLTHPRMSTATVSTVYSRSTLKKPPPTKSDMTDTVERIYLRYIVPNAEKELIHLPSHIRDSITKHFDNAASPDNPIIFAEAKTYMHQLLQATFPFFLRYKVYMNLTLHQQLARLALGLFALFLGFSLEFSLIFLNIHPWQKRLWVMSLIFFF